MHIQELEDLQDLQDLGQLVLEAYRLGKSIPSLGGDRAIQRGARQALGRGRAVRETQGRGRSSQGRSPSHYGSGSG